MNPTLLLFLAAAAAFVSCAATVFTVLFIRRGSDAALKGDVNELAQLVERISKETRRDRMRKVRAGEKVGTENTEMFPIPPGAEGIHQGVGEENTKEALRRRVLASRRIGA